MKISTCLTRTIVSELVLGVVFFADFVLAESNTTDDGKSTQASIHFRVIVPETLGLRVGAAESVQLSERKDGIQLVSFSGAPQGEKNSRIQAYGHLKKMHALQLTSSLERTGIGINGYREIQQLILCSP